MSAFYIPSHTRDSGQLHPALRGDGGMHRRFFWRVNHRFGKRWWNMPHAQVRKELRMMSWRRAH